MMKLAKSLVTVGLLVSFLANHAESANRRNKNAVTAPTSGPVLILSDGKKKDTQTISANSFGVLSFSGNVGKFTLSISTTAAVGEDVLPNLILNSLSYAGHGKKASSGTLTISLSDTSLTAPFGNVKSSIQGQTTGSLSYSTYADMGNKLLAQTSLLSRQGTFSNGNFSGAASAALSGQAPFSLTEVFTITQGSGGNTSFGATIIDPPSGPVTVPEGGSAFALLGLGLLGLALVRRKLTTS